MSRAGDDWSDVERATLKTMWIEEGASAATIGRALGRTRCAVLGMVHRSKDLPKRVTTVARSRAQTRVAPVPRRIVIVPKDIIPAEQLKAAEPPIYTRDLEDDHCRFPYDCPGAPDNAGYKYCGLKRSGASRYCDSHNVIVFQPQSTKRDMPNAG